MTSPGLRGRHGRGPDTAGPDKEIMRIHKGPPTLSVHSIRQQPRHGRQPGAAFEGLTHLEKRPWCSTDSLQPARQFRIVPEFSAKICNMHFHRAFVGVADERVFVVVAATGGADEIGLRQDGPCPAKQLMKNVELASRQLQLDPGHSCPPCPVVQSQPLCRRTDSLPGSPGGEGSAADAGGSPPAAWLV
jgi:hypothetical protein